MRATLLFFSIVVACHGANAQVGKVRSAREHLSESNYRLAIPVLEEAVTSTETKTNAEAWFLRGMAYLQMALDSVSAVQIATHEATASFLKAVSLSPGYGEEINNPMYSAAMLSFNQGVAAFSAKAYGLAYKEFVAVSTIFDAGGGRFSGSEEFKQLVGSANLNAAYAAVNDGRYKEAQPLLEAIVRGQSPKDSNVYQLLVEVYQKQGAAGKALAAIQEARKIFPESSLFRNLELNYYISSGNRTELLPRLEAAAKEDPNNPELMFNLANAYNAVAFVKDADDRIASVASDAFGKAEQGYKKALELSPDNPDYQYNLGVMYYSYAGFYNRRMAEITGTDAASQKRYDDLTASRDAQFGKALPYFERAYTILDARAATLSADEKITYQNSIIGLKEIYSRQGNKSKQQQMESKLQTIR